MDGMIPLSEIVDTMRTPLPYPGRIVPKYKLSDLIPDMPGPPDRPDWWPTRDESPEQVMARLKDWLKSLGATKKQKQMILENIWSGMAAPQAPQSAPVPPYMTGFRG